MSGRVPHGIDPPSIMCLFLTGNRAAVRYHNAKQSGFQVLWRQCRTIVGIDYISDHYLGASADQLPRYKMSTSARGCLPCRQADYISKLALELGFCAHLYPEFFTCRAPSESGSVYTEIMKGGSNRRGSRR